MAIYFRRAEEESKVLEFGQKIETMVVNRKPELTKSLEFTNKACDIVKQKTGIKLPLIVAKMFVGVGNMIVNNDDKVFFLIFVVATQQGEFELIIQMKNPRNHIL